MGLKFGVEGGVHGDDLITQDRGNRRSAKDPGEKVPPTGEETGGSAIFSSCYGGPVVDCEHVNLELFTKISAGFNQPPLDEGIAEASSARDAAMRK